MICSCGCGGAIKPGNKFASKGCSLRAIPKAERSARSLKWHAAGRPKPAQPDGPAPRCAYCQVTPVKWRRGCWNGYCDRHCAGAAIQERQTLEQQRRNGAVLTRHQQQAYAQRIRAEVERLCADVAGERMVFTREDLAALGLELVRKAKWNGYRAADMKWRRVLAQCGMLDTVLKWEVA